LRCSAIDSRDLYDRDACALFVAEDAIDLFEVPFGAFVDLKNFLLGGQGCAKSNGPALGKCREETLP
jgi:hypothetical protein